MAYKRASAAPGKMSKATSKVSKRGRIQNFKPALSIQSPTESNPAACSPTATVSSPPQLSPSPQPVLPTHAPRKPTKVLTRGSIQTCKSALSDQTPINSTLVACTPISTTSPDQPILPIHAPSKPTPTVCTSTTTISPYQRMMQLLASRTETNEPATTVITAVEDLQQFLRSNDQNSKVAIRMKLLWTSDHTYNHWQLVRLHFVDVETPESFDDMLRLFRTNYEANRQDVDSLLLTATIWNVQSDSAELPPPGSIVSIEDYSSLQLFRETQCQLTVKLKQLRWDGSDK